MSTLYIVATPIGNLKDITLRALEVLKQADLIACEDTRVTQKLLQHYQISKPLVSFHQHSRLQKVEWLVEQVRGGKNVVVVTDAGTPAISDPGWLLVREAVDEGVKVVTIPGPSALTAAVSLAGLPLDHFLFLGFLPHKKGRQTVFREIAQSEYPVILYESPHRILKTLKELESYIPKREVVVCRELTKMFETTYRGSIAEIRQKIISDKKQQKGEFVIIVNR